LTTFKNFIKICANDCEQPFCQRTPLFPHVCSRGGTENSRRQASCPWRWDFTIFGSYPRGGASNHVLRSQHSRQRYRDCLGAVRSVASCMSATLGKLLSAEVVESSRVLQLTSLALLSSCKHDDLPYRPASLFRAWSDSHLQQHNPTKLMICYFVVLP